VNRRRILAACAATLIPLLAAPWTIYVAGRGSDLPLSALLVGGAIAWAACMTILVRSRSALAVPPVILALAYALLLRSFGSSPLPAPASFVGELPPASPPSTMAIYQLPTGVIHRSAAFAYRGGAFSERRDFAMTAVFVEHPKGNVLIDTGLGTSVEAQLALMPLSFRSITNLERSTSAAEQLGGRPVAMVLPTHAHWDHVSGLDELPGIPVRVPSTERAFILDDHWLTAVARRAGTERYTTYDFTGPAYFGFPKSYDVYGDGSIVIVPAPGHTPGSVIVFVTLPTRRYAFVGDLVWQLEGITLREERPWLTRGQGDADEPQVRDNILRMASLASRFPDLVIVPAHDARAFASLPRL